MIPMTLAQIAGAVGGRVDGDPDVVVAAPPFLDSRSPSPGGLFVALAGAQVDGHQYAAAAVGAGAAAVLASRSMGVPTVLVADPVAALGRLARHVIDSLPGVTVLALTGSQGKTGTKDYLAGILATGGQTVATTGNLNNELGVPLTVLRATPETSYLVVEMGARAIGDVAYLCAIAPPRVAAVLNVGTAHIGEFGSREAIALAKGEIVEALPAEGCAVLNADDPFSEGMATRTTARVLSFGEAGDVSWRGLTFDALERPEFELGHGGEWRRVQLPHLGRHQVPNATAAAALAVGAGLGLRDIAGALSAGSASSPWRMEPHERADGMVVINDAYNANPASMVAALDTLAAIGRRAQRRTVAVLGEMRELGDEADAGHLAVGHHAASLDVDVVVAVGDAAALVARGARELEGWDGLAVPTAGRDAALAWLRDNVTADDVVLVKASRGAALEHLVDGLLAAPSHEGDPTR